MQNMQRQQVNRRYHVGDKVKVGTFPKMNIDDESPIDWIVIGTDDRRETALLLTERIIDSQAFTRKIHKDFRGWANSTLRIWLNNGFLSGFSDTDKEKIVRVTNENLGNENGLFGSEETDDRVFLLSMEEVETYVNDATRTRGDEVKIAMSTPYARTRGLITFDDDTAAWWLRSPAVHQDQAMTVCHDGKIHTDGYTVDDSHKGVRPAMWIHNPVIRG